MYACKHAWPHAQAAAALVLAEVTATRNAVRVRAVMEVEGIMDTLTSWLADPPSEDALYAVSQRFEMEGRVMVCVEKTCEWLGLWKA